MKIDLEQLWPVATLSYSSHFSCRAITKFNVWNSLNKVNFSLLHFYFAKRRHFVTSSKKSPPPSFTHSSVYDEPILSRFILSREYTLRKSVNIEGVVGSYWDPNNFLIWQFQVIGVIQPKPVLLALVFSRTRSIFFCYRMVLGQWSRQISAGTP